MSQFRAAFLVAANDFAGCTPLVLCWMLAFLPIVVLALVTSPLLAQNAPVPSPDESNYVGVDVCQGCHEDSYNSFMKSAHAATLKSKSAATRGCEGCHGPGAAHVNAGGDPERIERYSGVKADVILARCGRCHDRDMGKPHTDAHLSCLTCHSAHHSTPRTPLLVKPAQELCRGCHATVPSSGAHR